MVIMKKYVIISIAIIAIGVAAIFFMWSLSRKNLDITGIPGNLTVIVAWNPHSTADDMVRSLPLDAVLINMPGANGANGKNTVYSAPRDGENILATNLSAFVTAEEMGFSESSHRDWTGWLCAFAPAIVAVAADSPFETMNDLTESLRRNTDTLTGANSGFGTVSYIAAELFQTTVEFEHISYAGSSPAINALRNRDADFAFLISVEAVGALRSGELRALAAFTEGNLVIHGENEIIIPSISGLISENLPFGEYFGLFIPEDTPQARLDGIESMIKTAASSDAFANFIRERGLVAETPNKIQNTAQINRISTIITR